MSHPGGVEILLAASYYRNTKVGHLNTVSSPRDENLTFTNQKFKIADTQEVATINFPCSKSWLRIGESDVIFSKYCTNEIIITINVGNYINL